jgi:hypothetical protein
METAIPLLPCKALGETLGFYQTLGFEITYQQEMPYLYGAVRRGGLELHFSALSAYGAKNAFGASLVFVSDIAQVHHTFADALRAKHGKIPTVGFPRISRLSREGTRFKLFDPSGNLLIYIDRDEHYDDEHWETSAELSALALALENAVFLRDTYANDTAAAKLLDKALAQHQNADPLERARALASRAELAVALGDSDRAASLRAELRAISLSDADRERYRDELNAADALERWLTQPDA